MAKKQTRRSISVSRETYDRLKKHVANGGGKSSMSSFTESAVLEAMDNDVKLAARPVPTAVPNAGVKAAQ